MLLAAVRRVRIDAARVSMCAALAGRPWSGHELSQKWITRRVSTVPSFFLSDIVRKLLKHVCRAYRATRSVRSEPAENTMR